MPNSTSLPLIATAPARRTAATKPGPSLMTWSDGMITRMPSGLLRATCRAATAIAGAVLRATGSRMTAHGATPARRASSSIRKRWSLLPTMMGAANPAEIGSRSRVEDRKLCACACEKRMNCFGYIARDSGHRRVPDPPESTIGYIASRELLSFCTGIAFETAANIVATTRDPRGGQDCTGLASGIPAAPALLQDGADEALGILAVPLRGS